jgi:hypothetical protein
MARQRENFGIRHDKRALFKKFLMPTSFPEEGIIYEAEKIADMRWIWEVFRSLIITKS